MCLQICVSCIEPTCRVDWTTGGWMIAGLTFAIECLLAFPFCVHLRVHPVHMHPSCLNHWTGSAGVT